MRSETTFAKFLSKPGGLSRVQRGPLRGWELRGLRFTSACKSWAFHAPTGIPFPRNRFAFAMMRGSTLHRLTVYDLAVARIGGFISGRPEFESFDTSSNT